MIRKAGMSTFVQASSTRTALEAMMTPVGESAAASAAAPAAAVAESASRKRPLPADEDSDEDDQAHDEVRLWEDGFKERYYESKFDVGSCDLEFR